MLSICCLLFSDDLCLFLDACKDLGVPDHECFATVDLYEEQNMNQVVICISALMRKVSSSFPSSHRAC